MAKVTSTVVKESAEKLTQRIKEATTAREKDKRNRSGGGVKNVPHQITGYQHEN